MVLGPDLSSTTAAGGVGGIDGADTPDNGTATASEEWSPAWDAIASVFLPSTSFQPKTWNSNNNTASNPNSKYVVLDDDAGGGGGDGGFYRPEADGYGGFYGEDDASGFGYGYCDDDFEEFRGMDDGAVTPSSVGGGAGISGRRGGPTSSVLPSTAASSFATTPSFVSGGVGRPLPMLKKGSTARLHQHHHHRRESSSTGAGGFKSSSLATPTAAQLHNQSSAKYRPSSGGHHHHQQQQQQQQIQQHQPQRPTIFGEDGRPFRMPRGMARHGQRIIYGGVHMLIDHRNMLAGPDGRALRLLNAQSPHAWEAVLGIVPLAETGTSATSPSNAKKKAHASTIGDESTSTNGDAVPETYDEARRRAVEELAGAENVVAAAAANLPGLARVPSVCAVNSGASFANNHAGAALTATDVNAAAAADDDAIVAAILDRRRDALIDRAEARLRRSMLLLGGRSGGHLGGRVGGGGAANGRTRNKNVTEEGMGVVRAASSFSSAASSSSSSGSSLYSSDDDRNDSFTSSVISELSDLAAIRDVELYRFEHGNVTSSSVGPKGGTGGGEDSGYALSDEEREDFEALSRLVAARQSAMADQRALIAALNFPTTEAKLMAEQAERRRRAEADDRRRISEAFAACAAGAPLHDVAAAAGGANAWRYGPSAYSNDGAAAHTTKYSDAAPLPRPTSGASSLDSSPTPAHRYGPSSGIIGHSLLPLPFATKSRGYAHITAVDDILLGLDDSFASGSTAGRSLQSPVDVLEDGAGNEEEGEDDGAEDDDVAAEHRARFGAPITAAAAAAVAGAVDGVVHASAGSVGRSLDFGAASVSPQRHPTGANPKGDQQQRTNGEAVPAIVVVASAAKAKEEESSPMEGEQQEQEQSLLVESPMGGASALSEALPATPATMGAVGNEEALLLLGRGEHQPAAAAEEGGYGGFDNDEDDGGLAMMDPNQI